MGGRSTATIGLSKWKTNVLNIVILNESLSDVFSLVSSFVSHDFF